jgi:hypothetical protein
MRPATRRGGAQKSSGRQSRSHISIARAFARAAAAPDELICHASATAPQAVRAPQSTIIGRRTSNEPSN